MTGLQPGFRAAELPWGAATVPSGLTTQTAKLNLNISDRGRKSKEHQQSEQGFPDKSAGKFPFSLGCSQPWRWQRSERRLSPAGIGRTRSW